MRRNSHTRSRVNYPRQRGQGRPCKSFTTFHVQSNRHIFQKLESPQNYAYAYIEALLNYASPAKTSHLTSCLWDADIPDFMDETLDSETSNQALVRRARYIREERALDLKASSL